jgi:hypothetical protein
MNHSLFFCAWLAIRAFQLLSNPTLSALGLKRLRGADYYYESTRRPGSCN